MTDRIVIYAAFAGLALAGLAVLLGILVVIALVMVVLDQ